MEKTIIPFDLVFRPLKEESPALWLKVEGVDYLINPFALIESINIFGDICPLILSNPVEMKHRVFSIAVISNDDHKNHQYTWDVKFPDGRVMTWHFSDEQYEGRLLVQISELGRFIMKTGWSGYGMSITKKDAGDLMTRLLKSKYFSGWKGMKGIPQFEEEPFSMALIDGKDAYEINVGDQSVKGYVEDWEASFASWREALEHYLFRGECEIGIYFEADALTISVKSVHFLDYTEDDETGMYFQYGDTVLVTVQPNEYTEQGMLIAFCEEYDLIKGIYSTLLNLATRWDALEPDDDGESRRVKMFSPKVENYLVRNHHRDLRTLEQYLSEKE